MNSFDYHGYGVKPMIAFLNSLDIDDAREYNQAIKKYLKDHNNINDKRKERFKELAKIRWNEITTTPYVVERRNRLKRLIWLEKQMEERLRNIRNEIARLT